ncbi:hypothetical protein GCM10010182_70630 [Actinomadura cremea]|nr:hypothetical protein GCM10010182_70630 [Actinomadura cremea]
MRADVRGQQVGGLRGVRLRQQAYRPGREAPGGGQHGGRDGGATRPVGERPERLVRGQDGQHIQNGPRHVVAGMLLVGGFDQRRHEGLEPDPVDQRCEDIEAAAGVLERIGEGGELVRLAERAQQHPPLPTAPGRGQGRIRAQLLDPVEAGRREVGRDQALQQMLAPPSEALDGLGVNAAGGGGEVAAQPPGGLATQHPGTPRS